MAETKLYITQTEENGSVMISEDVISTIVAQAVSEVEGVSGLANKPGADIADIIGKNWGKGIKVVIGEKDDVSIDCNINVCYGCSVVKVAHEVQDAVASAVESMTGVTAACVNVNVCGIVR